MYTSKNAPKLQALSENPMVALTIDIEVHAGSRHDALRYAARVGAAQGGITTEEAASYIEGRAQDRRTLG